jgi:ABC-2 type transport system ATP-binding protein
LRKSFGERVGLAGIDLALEGAQLVGVVGPDGAGKTTLLRSLGGCWRWRRTRRTCSGVDLRGDVRSLKPGRLCAAGLQLPRELSVMENLRFTARLHRLPDDVFATRAKALLARTG